MAVSNRRGGLLHLSFNGKQLLAKGHFEINLGVSKKKSVYSTSMEGAVGFSSEPQSGRFKGDILIDKETNLEEILTLDHADAVIELSDGSAYAMKNGFFAGEGNISTEENSMEFVMEGPRVAVIKK